MKNDKIKEILESWMRISDSLSPLLKSNTEAVNQHDKLRRDTKKALKHLSESKEEKPTAKSVEGNKVWIKIRQDLEREIAVTCGECDVPSSQHNYIIKEVQRAFKLLQQHKESEAIKFPSEDWIKEVSLISTISIKPSDIIQTGIEVAISKIKELNGLK